MNQELEKIKEIVTPILRANGVEFAGIFGSMARGDQTEKSDVDFLVKFSGMPTFAGYLRLDEELRNNLPKEIDLITTGAVNKFMLPEIERDLKVIYGQRPNLS